MGESISMSSHIVFIVLCLRSHIEARGPRDCSRPILHPEQASNRFRGDKVAPRDVVAECFRDIFCDGGVIWPSVED